MLRTVSGLVGHNLLALAGNRRWREHRFMMSAIIEPNGESSRSASTTGRRTDGKRGAVPTGNRRHAEKMHVCATRREDDFGRPPSGSFCQARGQVGTKPGPSY
jgi:hypothetical protein